MRTLTLLLTLLVPPALAFGQQPPAPVPSPAVPAESSGQDANTDPNINARYTVEQVETEGIDNARLDRDLHDAMQALVGQRLDPDVARALERRLEEDLPGYKVRHAVERGSEPGRVRIVFRFEHDDNRHLVVTPSKIIYHQDQGWSTAIEVRAGSPRATEVAVGFVRFNNDDLVEEYTGIHGRVNVPRAGGSPFGVSLELSRYTQHWRDATLAAIGQDAAIPAAYRARRTVRPAFMVTFARGLRLTVGAAVTSLHPLDEGTERVKVGTGIASLRFTRTWDEGRGVRQDLDVEYDARGGLASLGSDLEYRRHQVRGSYRYQHGHSTVMLTGFGGFISGRAPLFERFTLGDSSTLRGWNKYDLAPAGTTRAFHQSVEYRYRKLAYFIDAGSLWNTDETRRIRLSTGIGLHSDSGFLTVGFPINADDVGATVILGVRF